MPGPVGVPPKSGPIHKRIHSIYQGDLLSIKTAACFPDGTVATPDNSRLRFTLVDDRYCQDSCNTFYTAEWKNNIEPINTCGGVEIKVPQVVTSTLRRGSFKYSLTLSDNLGQNRITLEDGTIMVEYAADAPAPNAYYRGDLNTQNHTLGGLE